MVRSCRSRCIVPFLTLCVIGTNARAQNTVAPALNTNNDPEYAERGVTVGSVKIIPSFDFSAEYTDNVYASAKDEKSDAIFSVRPQIAASYARPDLQISSRAQFTATRFAELSAENSNAFAVDTAASFRPQSGLQASADIGFRRLIEDRGDVERRIDRVAGPREIDVFSTGAGLRRERGRILFDLRGSFQKYDARAVEDSDRDFSTYGMVGKAGLRVAGATYFTITGFVSWRDFRLPGRDGSLNRDAKTFGARAGLDFSSDAFLDGHLAVGVFRFDANSQLIQDNTGLSVDAALTYRPRRRTAIVFNAFNGDVATFRLGATSRTDTSLGVTVQQEARHNLFGSAGFAWRNTKYRNNNNRQRTWETQGKVEYLLGPGVSSIATVSYSKRTSNNPLEPFERFRTSLSVRLAL